MQLLLSILNQIFIFCGGLALMEGIAQLVLRQRSKQNYVFAAFWVCLASYEIRFGLWLSGFMGMYPLIALFMLSLTYALGPLLYYYYILFSKSPLKSGRIIWLHFVIPAMFIIVEMIAYLLTPLDTLRYYIVNSLNGHASEPNLVIIRICFLAAGLSISFYWSVILKDLVSLYEFRKVQGIHLFIFFVVIIFGIIANLFYTVGLFIGDKEYLRICVFIMCIGQIFFYFMSYRYPVFLDIVRKDIHKKRYERTQLNNFDADAVNNRLLELMEEDRLYSDENISLNYLSECLKITPHQLSEFLNCYRNISFYTFITSYRIEEAKKLLLEDTDLTILQIAYSVGFNSKSAFNSAFQKFTGMTPQNFRKSKNQ